MSRWVGITGVTWGVLVFAVAGCGSDDATGLGSLLAACASDRDCGSPLTCECGVCTNACMDTADCAAVRPDATCESTAGVAACGTSPRAASVCAVLCSTPSDCGDSETCLEGRCRGNSTNADAGRLMDGGIPDGSTPDGSVSDAAVEDGGPVNCAPHEWSCNPGGTVARYCNARGDGFVREVDCGGRPCEDGLCAPRRSVYLTCGALKNGDRGELVGGLPCDGMVNDVPGRWTFTLWLDGGDRLLIRADALSPLVEAHVRISHRCEDGDLEYCDTSDSSGAGGAVQVERVAPLREAVRITFELMRPSGTTGSIDGGRLAYDIAVHPADPAPPPPPAVCVAGSTVCSATPHELSYCSAEGLFTRTHWCWNPFDSADRENPCVDGECSVPRGESCADAVRLVRPASDNLAIDARLQGSNNDLDPGTSCLDVGMSGADRVFRLDLTPGERIRATLSSTRQVSEIYGLYLLGSCQDPPRSCLAGSLGYMLSQNVVGETPIPAELTFEATRNETVYFVVDTERGNPDPSRSSSARTLTIRWDGTCSDGASNGDETGVDCGGPCDRGCLDGEACNEDADCQSRRCTGVRKICTRPGGCGDGVLSFDEQCDDGNAVDGDWCSDGCLVATCEDGIQNGDETSVDEGGYCAFPERDVCRRAEFVPLDSYTVLSGETISILESVDGAFAGASNARTPSCGADGLDQAFRFAIPQDTWFSFQAFAYDDAEPGVTQPVSVSVTRGCDGAEIACGFADRGLLGGGIPYTLYSPGEYIVWVEGDSARKADHYRLTAEGHRPL